MELEDLVNPANNRVLVPPLPAAGHRGGGFTQVNTALQLGERDDFEGGSAEENNQS